MKRLTSCILVICVVFLIASVSFAGDKEGKINLNTATKEQLMAIGLDEKMADAIIKLRKENGEFVDMEELMDIDGMNATLLRKLKKKLYIKPAKGCNC